MLGVAERQLVQRVNCRWYSWPANANNPPLGSGRLLAVAHPPAGIASTDQIVDCLADLAEPLSRGMADGAQGRAVVFARDMLTGQV